MPRANLIRNTKTAYHVTGRSNNKDWFYLPLSECWEIFCQKLNSISELYGSEIHAFVLMSNHFHLILSSPDGDISPAMRYLQTEVSRAINRATGRINHVFGGRYKWTILYNSVDYAYVYKYVLRNPARASIVERVEEYPFSTISESFFEAFRFPVVERYLDLWRPIPNDRESRLAWLNTPSFKEAEALVTRGLRRYEFSLPKGNSFRRDLERLRSNYGVENPESR